MQFFKGREQKLHIKFFQIRPGKAIWIRSDEFNVELAGFFTINHRPDVDGVRDNAPKSAGFAFNTIFRVILYRIDDGNIFALSNKRGFGL